MLLHLSLDYIEVSLDQKSVRELVKLSIELANRFITIISYFYAPNGFGRNKIEIFCQLEKRIRLRQPIVAAHDQLSNFCRMQVLESSVCRCIEPGKSSLQDL